MIVEKENGTLTTGERLAEEVRQRLAEEMRLAIAAQDWGRLARAFDAYSRMVK
jgi:hypothetical protein